MSVHAPRNNLIAGNDSGFPASIIKLQPFTLFCLFALLFISRPLFSNLEPMESYEGPFFDFPIRLDDQLCSPAGLEHADQYPAHQLSYQDGMSDFNLCVDAGQSSVAKGTIDTYSVFGVECQQSGIKNPSDGTRDMIKFSWPDRVEYISSPIMGQFQYPHAITVGDFHALLDSGLFVSGDNFMQGPVDLEADILQQSLAPQFMQLNTEVAPLQRFDVVEELHPVTPEIVSANASRKSSRNNNETNGCKHCNCKRSKCLKLYCKCFSAGFYCTERCSCAGCLNRPEYEDTVLDFRKQIELRNPHAFAPKVVKQGNGSPANTMQEELYQTPPFWERHKRGCNCKKSNCAKNYCECYQANVGCSEGCRCENCENPFVPITIAGVKHRQPVNQENQSPEPNDVLKTRNKYAWIERPNQSPEPLEVLKARDKYTRIERLNQSPPKREPLSDKSNVATISHPRLGLLALAPRATLH